MKKLFQKAATVFSGDPRTEVEGIRSSIQLLADDRTRTEALPRPLEEAMAQFEAYLDEHENRADLWEFASKFRWGSAHAWPTAVERAPGETLLAIMAMCFRDTMVEKFRELMTGIYEGQQTATREEQIALLANIDAEIQKLCHREERAIRQAAALGITIPRREDAPPAVVLLSDADLEAAL